MHWGWFIAGVVVALLVPYGWSLAKAQIDKRVK